MKFENLYEVLEEILFPKPTIWQIIGFKIDRALRKLGILCDHSFKLTGKDSNRKCSKCDFLVIDPAPMHFNCRCAMVPLVSSDTASSSEGK